MATGTGNLPNQGQDAIPFTNLTAQFYDETIENIESLADGTGIGDGAITATKIDLTTFPAAQQAWVTPTLSGGWVPFGNPFPALQYMKDSLGFVVLRGVSRLGTIGSSTVFTLPTGYRPATNCQVYQVVASNGVFGITEVKSNGDVVFSTGNNGAHSVNGVRFKAEQ